MCTSILSCPLSGGCVHGLPFMSRGAMNSCRPAHFTCALIVSCPLPRWLLQTPDCQMHPLFAKRPASCGHCTKKAPVSPDSLTMTWCTIYTSSLQQWSCSAAKTSHRGQGPHATSRRHQAMMLALQLNLAHAVDDAGMVAKIYTCSDHNLARMGLNKFSIPTGVELRAK